MRERAVGAWCILKVLREDSEEGKFTTRRERTVLYKRRTSKRI